MYYNCALCSVFSYTAPDDYTTVVQTLTFNPTTNSVNITVPIIDDSLLEDDEMFFGFISNPSDSRVTLAPDRANVTIEDFGDDGECSVERHVLLDYDQCKMECCQNSPSIILLIRETSPHAVHQVRMYVVPVEQ